MKTRPLQPGDPTSLGSYELLGRLGEGGQGVVYLGRRDDSRVAIKLLRAELTLDASARERFVREAMAATRVARFCTAQVYEADVAGDRPYIVSEYIPGPSLHKLVTEEGPREEAVLERLAVGTATALVAIHQAGIVHRDFKPHNVLMAPDGPRVIDFGIARALDVTATVSTRSIGTPAYMAPEQVKGEAITPAVDLFAWGVTMVFAATGQPAFGQDTIPAVAHRIITGEPHLDGLPDNLSGLVLDCLAKDPERRPQARDLLMRLLGHAAPAGVVPAEAPTAVLAEGVNLAAAETAALPRTDRTMAAAGADTVAGTGAPPTTGGRRTAVLAAVGAAILAGLVALVVVLLMNRNSAPTAPTPAPAVSSSADTGGVSQPAPAPATSTTEPAPATTEPSTTTTTSSAPPTTSSPPTSSPPSSSPPPAPDES